MKLKNVIVKKYVCCFDATLAARLIGFIGVAICTILVSILLNDKVANDYNASRKTAMALGLNWQHFHPSANTTHHADPEGFMISIIMIFYASLYLITSMSLIYATLYCNRRYTVPWLITEMFGCISKIVGLIFHAIYTIDQYDTIFVIGSVLYITIMSWWWLTVFAAQHSWKKDKNVTYTLETLGCSSNMDSVTTLVGHTRMLEQQESMMASPVPYNPNDKYVAI